MSVQATGLTKHYRGRRVLDGLDVAIGSGVTGLLGPNGAGKSTLLRCLATTLAPDAGTIRAFGLDPARQDERTALRRRLGYLPQRPGFHPRFTAFELVDYVALLKDLNDRRARHREVRRVLAEVDLTDRCTTLVRDLSGGMRQRLALAQALVGEPDLLVLDEPTVGLDPEQRLRFRALVSRVGESRTVLLSTHQTEDVAALCERVLVLNRGRRAFHGTPAELAASADGHVWLTSDRPTGGLFWRTAEGRYRVLDHRPPGGRRAEPSIEDGYLLRLAA